MSDLPTAHAIIQLYSVREDLDADTRTTVARLRAAGVTGVELYRVGAGEPREGLLTLLADEGIDVIAGHGTYLDSQLRPDNAVLDAAVAAGVGILLLPAPPAGLVFDAQTLERIADAINEAVAPARDRGLRLGYHNHWSEVARAADGRTLLEHFHERVDPAVTFEVDTYWAAAGGADVALILTRLGGRVGFIHLKDGGLALNADGQTPLGEGQVPIARILSSTDAVRILEFDRYPGDVIAALAQGLRRLAAGDFE
ncbi:MAG: TIM barrel protein [Gordonia sp. (in: high G+C Gram-positive bacteria)]